jgi:hypothetical protein
MTGAEPLRCPVCRAGFRADTVCSRCGADLEPLMRLAIRGWRLRESARLAFQSGDFRRVSHLAAEAQRLHATHAGRALRLVAEWSARECPHV